MEKYICQKCGDEKEIAIDDYKRTNKDAYCYCTPDTPSMYSASLSIKMMEKYEGVFNQGKL